MGHVNSSAWKDPQSPCDRDTKSEHTSLLSRPEPTSRQVRGRHPVPLPPFFPTVTREERGAPRALPEAHHAPPSSPAPLMAPLRPPVPPPAPPHATPLHAPPRPRSPPRLLSHLGGGGPRGAGGWMTRHRSTLILNLVQQMIAHISGRGLIGIYIVFMAFTRWRLEKGPRLTEQQPPGTRAKRPGSGWAPQGSGWVPSSPPLRPGAGPWAALGLAARGGVLLWLYLARGPGQWTELQAPTRVRTAVPAPARA